MHPRERVAAAVPRRNVRLSSVLKHRILARCPLQTSTRDARPYILALAALLALQGCASLGALGVVRPPRFRGDPDRPAELRLLGPGLSRPLGGASVRLYALVENPNAFGLTLSTVRGQLYLEGTEAADVDLPLGLPFAAGQELSVPIDLSIGFDNVPRLGDVLARAALGSDVGYRLEGTLGIEAGAFGQPTFGPFTLLQGDVRVRR
jgi:late embryogenesis abundant protein